MEWKPLKPLKEKLCISLDPDIVRRIREMAEEDDRSFSAYINKVLRDHIRAMDGDGR